MPLRRYWRLLARYLAPQRGAVLLLATLLLGGIALELLGPQLLRAFLDSAQGGAPRGNSTSPPSSSSAWRCWRRG